MSLGVFLSSDISCQRLRRGFSLVELLVVIAIIGLLISIILPTLGKAREAGRAVSCQANLRTMFAGWSIYMADANYDIPHTRKTTKKPNWVDGLTSVLPQSTNLFINNTASFNACPTAQSLYSKITYPVPGARWGYTINRWWKNSADEEDNYNGPVPNGPRKWGNIVHPERYPWFMDTQIWSTGADEYSGTKYVPNINRNAPSWGVGMHHGGSNLANVVFAGGNIKAVATEEIDKDVIVESVFPWFANQ